MRHSEVTDTRPANDNPRDDRQFEMFGEPQFMGVDWGRATSIGVVTDIRDGKLRGLRVIEGRAR